MDCNEVRDLIPEYVLGALEEGKMTEVELHLEQCPEARSLLREYEEIADALLYAVPLVVPPKAVRESIMDRIGTKDSRFEERRNWAGTRFAWVLAAIAVLLLLASNLYWVRTFHRTERELSYRSTVVALIAGNHVVELHGQAEGMMHYDPESNVGLLEVFGMPVPPKGKSYQLWLIRPDQERDSGAVFRVEENGNGVVIFHAPRPLSEYVGVGVTLEPEGGSRSPTGPKVLGGRLSS